MGKHFHGAKEIKELLESHEEVTFISNVKINGIKNKTKYFKNTEELIEALKEIDINNNKGYLIFIDEIHVVLAELFGKTDPIFLTFLSQQRKLNIYIIGTCQKYSKLPKFIREYLVQSGQIIICKNIFKIIQINKYINMEDVKEDNKGNYVYKDCKIKWFIHTKEDYERYDTYAVISQIQGLMKGSLNYGDRLSNNNGTTTEA